jgi:hypothetical protein
MQYVAKYRTFIKMVNISICSPGKELITLYLKGISALIEKKERETFNHVSTGMIWIKMNKKAKF